MSPEDRRRARIAAKKQELLALGVSVSHLTTARRSRLAIVSTDQRAWSHECEPDGWLVELMVCEAVDVARSWVPVPA